MGVWLEDLLVTCLRKNGGRCIAVRENVEAITCTAKLVIVASAGHVAIEFRGLGTRWAERVTAVAL